MISPRASTEVYREVVGAGYERWEYYEGKIRMAKEVRR